MVPQVDVNLLLELDNSWYLVSLSREASNWVRHTYKEDIQWREYLDGDWQIYYNRLEVDPKILSILRLKYPSFIDNTLRWKQPTKSLK